MRKTFTLFLAVMAIAICNTAALSAADITVKLLRPAAWTATPHIHIYHNDGTQDITDVDNQEMTPVEGLDNWFYYEVKNCPDGYNVMFNNGGWAGGQSSAYYEVSAGNYAYTINEQLQPIRTLDPTAESVTLMFLRPSNWSAIPHIHIYHSDGTKDITDVNDQAMTAVDGKDGWFYYIFQNYPENYNVMFNNGGWAGGQVGSVYIDHPQDASFEVVDGELRMVGTTGIEDVEASAAPIEYFDLSGLRVDGDNLEKGIYIMRQGKKISKTIIR